MTEPAENTGSFIGDTFSLFESAIKGRKAELSLREVGTVVSVGEGIARVSGLPGAKSEELVRFEGGQIGMVFNLDVEDIGIILLDDSEEISAGSTVRRTGKIMSAPVGDGVLGRVIDATGERDPVVVPLQTGLKVVDALIPVGRGQRELILGDRQTGKTAIGLDTIINQHDKNVLCVYCAIGKRASAVANVVDRLNRHGAIEYSIVVVATGDDPPGLQFITPYAATTMAEYFMEQGRDVLIIYDDLTNHSVAYRELSLLLRRPPGREAFPGDIFYIHSRLLERSTHLREEFGGGSLTSLPIAETQAQNVSAYIPTNLISITDGQLYLSPGLFQKGNMPAVHVGQSVSRVGGKTQFPAYRAVAGDLRLSYSQFEELEAFSRFGTRLDEQTKKTLERGKRVREVLKQPQFLPISASEQITVLLAVTGGELDRIPVERVGEAEDIIRRAAVTDAAEICRRIENGEKFSDEDRKKLLAVIHGAVDSMEGIPEDGIGRSDKEEN
ncbi:MAG: F0F1 ATP synthase subunit alpha [Planctomycetota bacterium]|jgi:F-type H+-transporting ATPase subunit alpha